MDSLELEDDDEELCDSGSHITTSSTIAVKDFEELELSEDSEDELLEEE
jgi:hypothetical protein